MSAHRRWANILSALSAEFAFPRDRGATVRPRKRLKHVSGEAIVLLGLAAGSVGPFSAKMAGMATRRTLRRGVGIGVHPIAADRSAA